MSAFKGDRARPETIERRKYHQDYWQAQKRYPATCPLCGRFKSRTIKVCRRCDLNPPKPLAERFICLDCGGPKHDRASKRCRSCATKAGFAARLTRAKSNPYCPNKAPSAECDSQFPHRHCECGWPIAPDKHACHICIAEQPRIEFKTWPREDAA